MSSENQLKHILSCLEGVEETSAGSYKALCPAHDDHDPSLSVSAVVEKAPRRCSSSAGRAASRTRSSRKRAWSGRTSSLRMALTTPRSRAAGSSLPTTTPMRPATSCTRASVTNPRDFLQRRPDGSGGWDWNLKGVEPVLYRLPEVLEACLKGETIYVFEGEKDVDRAREELGITATTCAMGAGKWRKSYTHTLVGANVILVPDNDEAGRKHVPKVAQELKPVAVSVKILELPGLHEKDDLTDWIDAGGTREEFERLSSLSQPYIPGGDGDDLFGAVRFADLGEPEPRTFVVEDLVPQGHSCLLHGGGGSAKSILADVAGHLHILGESLRVPGPHHPRARARPHHRLRARC